MKTFNNFMEQKKCPAGMKWDSNLKDCVPSGLISVSTGAASGKGAVGGAGGGGGGAKGGGGGGVGGF